MDHQVQILSDSQVATRVLTQALEARGFRVYLSFDLRNALDALPDCGCPHHGTDQCTCQFTVLLVYGNAPSPAQVVVHGRDGQTWLSVPVTDDRSTTLPKRILEILTTTFPQEPGQEHYDYSPAPHAADSDCSHSPA